MSKATCDETDELITKLQAATSHMAQFDMYREKLDEADIEPSDINSIETFRQLPTMDAETLARDFTENPPFGSLIPDDESIARINLTPNPYMTDDMPVVTTSGDVERSSRSDVFQKVGVTKEDVVLNTASMTPYAFGWTIATAAEDIGATHIPMGPGDSEKQAATVERFDVSVICGFPSFILQIGESAHNTLDSVELIIAAGEPFTAIDGYRERVRDVFGGAPTIVDGYGLSEVGSVAREMPEEDGMHVFTDSIFPEVVDPETGELVDRGEKGELVLTHLTETSVPVLRFRTHDLTILEKRGDEYILPKGVFGRTDRMQKIKGVKVYPDELLMHLAGIDGVDHENVQFIIEHPENTTHRLHMRVKANPEEVSEQSLVKEIQSKIAISVDELELDEELDVDKEDQIVERFPSS